MVNIAAKQILSGSLMESEKDFEQTKMRFFNDKMCESMDD